MHITNPPSQTTHSRRLDPPPHSHRPPRYGPADTRASQEVQHSWAALFFNKELGYLDLPIPLLSLPPGLCPQDSLLGFPLLEQMFARLLNCAVAPPTGALADLRYGPMRACPVVGGHLVLIRIEPLWRTHKHTAFPARSDPKWRKPRGQPDAAPLPTRKQKKNNLSGVLVAACPVSSIGHSVAASSRTPSRRGPEGGDPPSVHDFRFLRPLGPAPTPPALHGGPTLLLLLVVLPGLSRTGPAGRLAWALFLPLSLRVGLRSCEPRVHQRRGGDTTAFGFLGVSGGEPGFGAPERCGGGGAHSLICIQLWRTHTKSYPARPGHSRWKPRLPVQCGATACQIKSTN